MVRSNGSRQAVDGQEAAQTLLAFSSQVPVVPAAPVALVPNFEQECLVEPAEPAAKRSCSDAGSVVACDTERVFHCGINGCFYRARIKHSVVTHQETHMNAATNRIRCGLEECGFVAQNHCKIMKHRHNHHSTPRVYACEKPRCDFRSSQESDLDTHECKGQGAKPIQCGVNGCKIRHVYPRVLDDHKRKNHGRAQVVANQIVANQIEPVVANQKKPDVACGIGKCGVMVPPFFLERHRNTHSAPRNFACDVGKCALISVSQGHLDRHKETCHGMPKVYACDTEGCSFRSINENDLDTHVCLGTGRRSVKCGVDECSERFKSDWRLKKHKFNVHQMVPYDPK